MIIKQLPVSERPREKMLAMGTRALSNRELLAVLLGSGSKERSALVIADELLQMDSRGLRSLADCSGKDLARIRGIGQAKASILMAAIELGRRIADESRYDSIRISSTSDVLGVCMERMRYYSKEYCQRRQPLLAINNLRSRYVVVLNQNNTSKKVVFRGTLRQTERI